MWHKDVLRLAFDILIYSIFFQVPQASSPAPTEGYLDDAEMEKDDEVCKMFKTDRNLLIHSISAGDFHWRTDWH